MSGFFKVDPEEVNRTSSQLKAGSGSIEAQLATLRGQVDSLGATWAGAAQGSFTELYTQWQTSAKQLNEALNGISVLLAKAGQEYATTESALTGSFRG